MITVCSTTPATEAPHIKPWTLRTVPTPARGPNWWPSLLTITVLVGSLTLAVILVMILSDGPKQPQREEFYVGPFPRSSQTDFTGLQTIAAFVAFFGCIYFLMFCGSAHSKNERRRARAAALRSEHAAHADVMTRLSKYGERLTVLLGVTPVTVQAPVTRSWPQPPSPYASSEWDEFLDDATRARQHYANLLSQAENVVKIASIPLDRPEADIVAAMKSLRQSAPNSRLLPLLEVRARIAARCAIAWTYGNLSMADRGKRRPRPYWIRTEPAQYEVDDVHAPVKLNAIYTEVQRWSVADVQRIRHRLEHMAEVIDAYAVRYARYPADRGFFCTPGAKVRLTDDAAAVFVLAHCGQLSMITKNWDDEEERVAKEKERVRQRSRMSQRFQEAKAALAAREEQADQEQARAVAAAQPPPAPAPPVTTPSVPTEADIEERLVRIGAAVALPAEVWRRLERSLRAYLLRDPAAPRGIVLHGPPGTGKTTIAKAIAAHAQCAFFPLSAPDIKQSYVGASGQKVREVWDNAQAKAPAIIFIDECDAIFQKRGGARADVMTDEIVSAILPRMDGMSPGSGVLVIGATNRFDALDAAMVSRFDLAVHIPPPDLTSRRAILAKAFATYRFEGAPPVALVEKTDGMSGRDIDAIVRSARQEFLAGIPIATAFDTVITAWRARSGAQVDRSLTWDDVIVADDTKRSLMNCGAMLSRRDEFKRDGLDVLPKGILLHGPPGTGKTQLARVLAAQCGVGFLTAATGDLKASYLGQSAALVKDLFERARSMSPCILFIDEIDIIAPDRGGASDALCQEVIGQLLQEIDGVTSHPGHVFVMAASNAPDSIDSAILSRFSERIAVPLPDRDQRVAITLRLLKGRPLSESDTDLANWLADCTDGASGRDLKNRIEKGLRRVVERRLAGAGSAAGLTRDDLT